MTSEQKIKKEKVEAMKKYVPTGQSPRIYIDLVRNQIMGVDKQGKSRPEQDLIFFLYVCKRTGLDPVLKQIYPVYRWDNRIGAEKMTIQVGIDGMRLIAQRSNEYGGQDDINFLPEIGEHPDKATATVYKVNQITGERMPIVASARWSEYAQLKDGKAEFMWARMPYNQLGKCAEALALRKAFPNELSGIYSDDEIPKETALGLLPKPEKKEKTVKIESTQESTFDVVNMRTSLNLDK